MIIERPKPPCKKKATGTFIKGGATCGAGGAPTFIQLWDNLKLRRLRYTLVWQAKTLGPDDHTLYEAI